jgi:hypothetical protein
MQWFSDKKNGGYVNVQFGTERSVAVRLSCLHHGQHTAAVSALASSCSSALLHAAPSDILAAAAAAAAAAVQFDMPLAAADAADLLQLAVNCSSTATAEAAGGRVPHMLEPSAARRLWVTAIARQHAALVRAIAYAPDVGPHLDAFTVSTAWRLVSSTGSGISGRKVQLHQLLEQLPATQQLGVRDVAALLQTPVHSCGEYAGIFMQGLCSLPAAQQLACGDVLPLLQMAVAACDTDSACKRVVSYVCGLPAAQQLSAVEVMPLLQVAVAASDADAVWRMCALPAARKLSTADVMRLLQGDADAPSLVESSCACTLIGLPAAGQMSREDVARVLHMAVLRGSVELTCRLSTVAAARRLDSSVVEQLISAAKTCGAHGCVAALESLWPA